MKSRVNRVSDVMSDTDKLRISILERKMRVTKSKVVYDKYKHEIADIIKSALLKFKKESA